MDSRKRLLVIGIAIAALVAASSAWIASGEPDGLERVAEDKGFDEAAQDPGYEILPDYTVPGIDGEMSTVIAGLIGVALMTVFGLGIGRLLAQRRGASGSTPNDPPR